MLVQHKNLKGSTLAFSLLLLSLLLFSGITLLSVSLLERKATLASQKSAIAFQAADSGAERVLKRIYMDNSPLLATIAVNVPLSPSPPYDGTLNALAGNLTSTSGAGCTGGIIGATNTNSPPTASPSYTFQVTFFSNTGTVISCSDNQWRDKVVRIRSEGFYQGTSRVIEIGIRARK